MRLDDLDVADDLILLSHTQQQMQGKTISVAAAVGLNIHKEKSKIIRHNTACTNRIILDGEALEDVKTFTYLGSTTDEGTDRQNKSSIFTTEEHLEPKTTVCQLASKSEFSIQMSRQFYCMGRKLGELRKL
ncbi:unnamed protein product [Schistosoma margrebowiei]|uniref:Uncharacterized protein n=1 Tax=Schistosoma margrebowiei TaxID=48269 RepID=A0A183MYX2_9TREM|nr:unnamed protein product [Schistosoma margrebowiei]